MFSFYDFLTFVAGIVQMFGLLILGIAAGWFIIYAFVDRPWQVQIAAILGGFFLAAAIVFAVTPSGVGAFALGFGGALLGWGLIKPSRKSADADEA